MIKKYSGVVVPMITPFTEKGKIDCAAVVRICQNFVENGVSPFLLGTTGESSSISPEDSLLLVKTAVEATNRKVLVYAGLSNNCVNQNIKSAKAYFDLGIDVIVSVLPNYYPLTSDQMYEYYIKIAETSSCPVMVYNIPSTTNMSIPLDVVQKLSEHPNICGFKDSENNEQRMEKCLGMFTQREDFSYFIGAAKFSAVALRKGADGIVPSTANFVPGMFRKLYDLTLANNWNEAERIQNETNEIAKIYQEGRTLGQSLPALKTMMSVIGLCSAYTILPLTTPSVDEQCVIIAATKEIMKKYPL
jgi:dihydrodipicolinate synthase/N-acetylneuraminate lyase